MADSFRDRPAHFPNVIAVDECDRILSHLIELEGRLSGVPSESQPHVRVSISRSDQFYGIDESRHDVMMSLQSFLQQFSEASSHNIPYHQFEHGLVAESYPVHDVSDKVHVAALDKDDSTARCRTPAGIQAHAPTVYNCYLSQCCIFNALKPFDDMTGLAGIFPVLPPSLPTGAVPCSWLPRHSQTNVWMSACQTVTNAHIDEEDNILCVIKGCKLVALTPPTAPDPLMSFGLTSRNSHHSEVSLNLAALHGPDCNSTRTDSAVQIGSTVQLYHVRAGEALFIPEGWWHEVFSSAGTIAVNYWGYSQYHDLASSPSAPHITRKLLKSLCMQHAQQRCRHKLESAPIKTGLSGGSYDEMLRLLGSISSIDDQATVLDYLLMALPGTEGIALLNKIRERGMFALLTRLPILSDLTLFHLKNEWEELPSSVPTETGGWSPIDALQLIVLAVNVPIDLDAAHERVMRLSIHEIITTTVFGTRGVASVDANARSLEGAPRGPRGDTHAEVHAGSALAGLDDHTPSD